MPATVMWPLSSAVAAAIFTLVLATQYGRRRLIEPGPFPLWVVVVYVTSIVGVAGLWVNVVGFPFAPNAGPYAIVLTWALCVFGFIFFRTIELFLHRGPSV